MKVVVIVFALVTVTAIVVVAVPSLRRALVAHLPASWKLLAEARLNGIDVDRSVRMVMPDGRKLAATIYLPRDASRPLATVLIRLPYKRDEWAQAVNGALFFARNGYAVVVQDLRGTGDSDGEMLPWRDVAEDGVATLDWIASQSWSNGKVGTFGCSALGETQFVLAARRHPAQAALIASGAGGAIGTLGRSYGYFGLFEGGVFQLASGFGWFAEYGAKDPGAPAPPPFDTASVLRELPVNGLVARVRPDETGYTDYLDTPIGDPRWEQWGFLSDTDQIAAPAFVINGWYDQTVGDTLVMAEHNRSSGQAGGDQRVVIAPGGHCDHESRELPMLPGMPSDELPGHTYRTWYLRWFDRWLLGKGSGLSDIAPYTYYMLGEDRWYEAASWPPANARIERWYLQSGGAANTRSGDGLLARTPPEQLATDAYDYDPRDPVPTRGGSACCTGDAGFRGGQVDQADVEARRDVLVYTSPPLAEELRIAGPLKAVLTVSADTPDTDLVVRLVDVSPEGVALNVQEGALRLRYRKGPTPNFLETGERYKVTVDMRSIAYRLAQGHRLRLHVTGSTFPRLERNLNTGTDNHRESEMRVAHTSLHHGPADEAYIELPVLGPSE